MFKNIRINSYRGLHDIKLMDLGQVNVLVGENNSGKTSVLEAIQLFADNDVLTNMISIAKKREAPLNAMVRNRLQSFDAFLYSFPMQYEQSREICLESYSDIYGECRVEVYGEIYREAFYELELSEMEMRRYGAYCDENGKIRIIRGEYFFEKEGKTENSMFYFRETQAKPEINVNARSQRHPNLKQGSIMYISPMDIYTDKILSASLYKGMLVEEKQRLLDLMCLFDDRIIGIETAVLNGRPATMIEMEGMGLVPISVFGDGLKKILTLASAVVKMRNGVILIDEFETGIHKRVLKQVAEWMLSVTKRYNVQVFLTTHSSDAIAALVEVQETNGDSLRAYRLEHYKNDIYVKKFTGNDLYMLRNSQGMDIL